MPKPKTDSKNDPKSEIQSYRVTLSFTRTGTCYVDASSEEEARELVMKHCHMKYSEMWSSHPTDGVGWEFPFQYEKTIGEVQIGGK